MAHHDHHHDHHSHGHAHPGAGAKGRAFAIGLSANLAYMIVEIIAGLAAHSLALVS